MEKAFTTAKKERGSPLKVLIPIAVFVLIAVIVVVGVNGLSSSADAERLKTMEQSVRRSVVQCYAIEGRYPFDLEYLEDNYGLILDRERFVYHYQMVGANILPQIVVFSKN